MLPPEPMAASELLLIDGSHGEGGGQILRAAAALAVLHGRSIRVDDIRANRPKPGLRASHLAALQAVNAVSAGRLENAEIGSTSIEFHPGVGRGGDHELDIGTAGAITLVLQAVVPIAVFSEPGTRTHLSIRGGTDVPWSPPIDFFDQVFAWWLLQAGVSVRTETKRRGFYPKGGGSVAVDIEALDDPIDSVGARDRGGSNGVHLRSVASSKLAGARVAERQIEGFEAEFPDVASRSVDYVDTFSPGSAIQAVGRWSGCRLGTSALGKKEVRAEAVGAACARELRSEIDSGAVVDRHAADQLLLYAATAKAESTLLPREVSGHMETMMWLLRQFTSVAVHVKKEGNHYEVVVCPGGSDRGTT